MTKLAFLDRLRCGLRGLPEADVAASLDYYAEMIDERMESGMTEEEAVSELDSPEETARAIILDMPLPQIIKNKCKKTHPWRAWEIVLLVLGSPIWLPLLITAASILLCIYIVLWAIVLTLWAVDVSFVGLFAACLITAVTGASGGFPTLLLYGGLALISAGLAVFDFFACLKLTLLFAGLSAKFGRWVKSLFVRKQTRKEDTL